MRWKIIYLQIKITTLQRNWDCFKVVRVHLDLFVELFVFPFETKCILLIINKNKIKLNVLMCFEMLRVILYKQ